MSVKNGSAEIYELEDARARRRATETDPGNFVAVGPYLEAVRVGLGLSVGAVSERTHIKPVYIEAIEAMTIEALPGKPFAIGFVKVYAEALGLDPAPVVARFKAEAGFERPSAEASVADSHRAAETGARADAAASEAGRELSLFAVLGVLAFMLWCAYAVTRPREVTTPFGSVSAPATADADAAAIPAMALDVDILERVEAVYPPHCLVGAAPVESVLVAFTARPDGRVATERVVETTNACFNRNALNAIRLWRFAPPAGQGPAYEQAVRFDFRRPS